MTTRNAPRTITLIDYQRQARRLADLLDHGNLFECAGQVVYGWRVNIDEDPTSDAAELLMAMAEEIERLSSVNPGPEVAIERICGRKDQPV